MNEIEYFEKNKDKIKKTAEFLCQKDGSSTIEEKFKELELQYYNKDGTHHKESITINDQPLNINDWLEALRHEKVEHIKIIAVTSKGSCIIYQVVGDQHSTHNINLDEIHSILLNMIIKGIADIGVYVYHNHPFIYKASPSATDITALETIVKELKTIEQEGNLIGKKCQVILIDFSIATVFDYWSFKQS